MHTTLWIPQFPIAAILGVAVQNIPARRIADPPNQIILEQPSNALRGFVPDGLTVIEQSLTDQFILRDWFS